MIQITLQFSTIAAAVSALARIDADAIVAGNPVPHAVVSNDKADIVAQNQMAAPGKPSDAKAARSQRTAEAAPSPSVGQTAQADAPAKSTEPSAAPPSTGTPAGDAPVTYPDLQRAVLALHKMDPTAAVPIAKGLGADTFKLLPETKWAEALAQVNAAIAQRKVA